MKNKLIPTQEDLQAFLAKGGQVEKIPEGTCTDRDQLREWRRQKEDKLVKQLTTIDKTKN